MSDIKEPQRRWEDEPLHEPIPQRGPAVPAEEPAAAPQAPERVREPVEV